VKLKDILITNHNINYQKIIKILVKACGMQPLTVLAEGHDSGKISRPA
jgi:hypothetical protein